MKILHFISSNGLFGAERVILNLASNMNYNGLKPYIAVVKNSQNPHLELAEKAQERGIPTFIVESRGRFDLKSVSRLYDFIKENNISILHTHNYKANFIGFATAKRAEIPIVATLHGYIGNGRKLRFYEAIDRFILRFFDKVILVDDSLKKWFKNGGVKYKVVNNGINIDACPSVAVPQLQLKSELRIKDDDLVIGTAGRLSQEKGHKYLLEAFAKLAKDYPHIRLLIIGNGELRKDLEKLSEALGIDGRVTFAGFQEDIEKYYSLMDIYVSASLIEHFPLSILEAMRFGRTVVATNVGGTHKMVIDKYSGILINPNSTHEIYNALMTLIKNSSLRKTLGETTQQFVKENYSLEKMTSSYKKIYEEVLCG